MLKRIEDIKAVGCFYHAHPASVQFEPLTFIYGENCYGKTTLCDIFRSLAENRPEYLTARASVPNPDNLRQRVQLGVTFPGQQRETTLAFDGDEWSASLPAGMRLLVFDTDFIHRNVFTGLTIERRNQENITEFVLGESSVAKAQTIGEQNSLLRALNKQIRQLEADVFGGLADVGAFVALEAEESPGEIQDRISSLGEQIATKKDLLDNLGRAAARNEPQPIALPDGFLTFVERVNDCLTATYERAHRDAAERVHRHIEHKTNAVRTTQQWLREGLEQVRGEECPFCGQSLQGQAAALLAVYREFFDEAFKQFVSETMTALKQFPADVDEFRCVGLSQSMRENESALSEYPELAQEADFAETASHLAPCAALMVECWQSWQKVYKKANSLLFARIGAKQAAVHARAESWECTAAVAAYSQLKERAAAYNIVLCQLTNRIIEFKGHLDAQAIREEIASLERQQADQGLRQRRQQLADACARYSKLASDRSVTKENIDRLRNELQQEQARFLDDYFEAINSVFSRLGSGSFHISKVETRRGNIPVVQLGARYSGVPITPDRLPAFFSESDRRALALSIFWAKTDLLTDAEKEATVLILDDPVTSFDDGRVDRTIRLMESTRASFRQIVVLSHYPRYLKSFFDRAHLQAVGIQIARIVRTDQGSQLQTACPVEFVETEQQAKFRHIVDFVERRHREDVCQDLRVYLETEVRSRYRKQVADNNLTGSAFGDLLDALRDLGCFSRAVRDETEQYRLSLNPDHHGWTGRTHEDKVALASDLLEFIYVRL